MNQLKVTEVQMTEDVSAVYNIVCVLRTLCSMLYSKMQCA